MTMATLGEDMAEAGAGVVAGAGVGAGAGLDAGAEAGFLGVSSSEWLLLRRRPGKHIHAALR